MTEDIEYLTGLSNCTASFGAADLGGRTMSCLTGMASHDVTACLIYVAALTPEPQPPAPRPHQPWRDGDRVTGKRVRE